MLPFLNLILILHFSHLSPAAQNPKTLPANELFDQIVSRYDLESWRTAKAQSQEKRLKKQTAWSNPQLEMGWGRATEGPFRGEYREWSLSQVIPINGEKARKNKQWILQKDLSQLEGRQLSQEIQAEVIGMIYLHQYNKERAAHIKERIERLNHVDLYLKNRKFASPRDQIEKALIHNRIKHLKIEIIEIENDLKHTLGYFKQFIPLESNQSLDIQWPDFDKIENLFLDSLKSNEFIEKQISTQLKMNQYELESARKLWIPDLKVYYMQTFQEQFMQEPVLNDAFGLGISIPVFNLGRDEVAEKTAAYQTLEYEKNQEKIKRSSERQKLKSQFYRARMTLKEFNAAYVKKVDQDLDKATVSFKKGLVPASSYLDLEDQVHESLHLVFKAKTDMINTTLESIILSHLEKDLRKEFL